MRVQSIMMGKVHGGRGHEAVGHIAFPVRKQIAEVNLGCLSFGTVPFGFGDEVSQWLEALIRLAV